MAAATIQRPSAVSQLVNFFSSHIKKNNNEHNHNNGKSNNYKKMRLLNSESFDMTNYGARDKTNNDNHKHQNKDNNNDNNNDSKNTRNSTSLVIDIKQLQQRQQQDQPKQEQQQQQQQQLQQHQQKRQHRQLRRLPAFHFDTHTFKSIEAFVKLCEEHRKLFESSKVFDIYLISAAFLFLRRFNLHNQANTAATVPSAGNEECDSPSSLSPFSTPSSSPSSTPSSSPSSSFSDKVRAAEYTTDNLLAALYLAVAMEEDSEEGIHELIVHFVGVSNSFPQLRYVSVEPKCSWAVHADWRVQLNQLYRLTNQFWRQMDFNASVNQDEVLSVSQLILSISNNNTAVFKTRTSKMLETFRPYW